MTIYCGIQGLGCEYDWLKEENEQLKKKNKRSYYIL